MPLFTTGWKYIQLVGGWPWNFWIINSIFHFQTIRTIEMFWIRSFSPIRDCFLKKNGERKLWHVVVFRKMGVDDRIARQIISWQENTLRFCQIRPPAGGMIQVRPGKKLTWGTPLKREKTCTNHQFLGRFQPLVYRRVTISPLCKPCNFQKISTDGLSERDLMTNLKGSIIGHVNAEYPIPNKQILEISQNC